MMGYLSPNSDELSLHLSWWWGNRYPITLTIADRRHGENIMGKTSDNRDTTIFNAGSNVLQVKRNNIDSENAPFLAGKREDMLLVQLSGGVEIIRGFNIQLNYRMENVNSVMKHTAALTLRFDDF
ncbi:MAG: hypothetical protein IPM69_15190 [Ignavibacteria bacterium]|nr:hypothetical protein [Ignavibacteria bacterium]